jgi:serine/threonine-protein kinase
MAMSVPNAFHDVRDSQSVEDDEVIVLQFLAECGWTVVRSLGGGCLSMVFEASRQGRRVVVKVARPRVLRLRPQIRLVFERERLTCGRLWDPCLPLLLSAGELPGLDVPFLEFAFIEGISLYSALEACGALSETAALELADQIGEVIQRLHERWNMLYADLKPEHVLLPWKGGAAIIDLGSATPLDESATLRFLGGSGDYCPPECRCGLIVSVAADVYALAMLVLRMQAGDRPWQEALADGRLSDAMKGLLQVGLAECPEERYSSVGSFRRAMQLLRNKS